MPTELLKCSFCGGNLTFVNDKYWICDYCGKTNIVYDNIHVSSEPNNSCRNNKGNDFVLSIKKEDGADYSDVFNDRITLKFEFMPRSTKADTNPSQIKVISSTDEFVCLTNCPPPKFDKITVIYNGSSFNIRYFRNGIPQDNEIKDSNYESTINGIRLSLTPV